MTKDSKIIGTDDASIERAASTLAGGGLVGMPTETVYGLAANALSDEAVARIYEAKGRPSFNPLIVHVRDAEQAAEYADVNPLARKIMQGFWPGPLTIVLPRRADCSLSPIVSADLETVALRAPGHEIAQALLRKCGLPLAAPSANKSGTMSPTTAAHVTDGLGDVVDLVLDGGACDVGVESTIIGISGDKLTLLRPGSITPEQIEALVNVRPDTRNSNDPVSAPGQLSSHYAPQHALRTSAFGAGDDEIMIGFGAVEGDLNLSPSGNVAEAARNLFATLRAADHAAADMGKSGIAVAPIPFEGIGIAINDRLERAAAPRE